MGGSVESQFAYNGNIFDTTSTLERSTSSSRTRNDSTDDQSRAHESSEEGCSPFKNSGNIFDTDSSSSSECARSINQITGAVCCSRSENISDAAATEADNPCDASCMSQDRDTSQGVLPLNACEKTYDDISCRETTERIQNDRLKNAAFNELILPLNSCKKSLNEVENIQNDIFMLADCNADSFDTVAVQVSDAEFEVQDTFTSPTDGIEACDSNWITLYEDTYLNNYFDRKFKCGGSSPCGTGKPRKYVIQEREQADKPVSPESVCDEKERMDCLLQRSEILHTVGSQNRIVYSTKGFKHDDHDQTALQEVSYEAYKDNANDDDEDADIIDEEKALILRNVIRPPSSELPWPLVDMNMVVGYVQHEELDDIFRMMTSANPPGPQTTMKYELLRLCTYRHFPLENKPFSIRLAGAGFYYAGEGDELTCYCCGLRKRDWTSEDIPIMVHERSSPRCAFMAKNLDVNVPVPHPTDTRPNRLAIFDVLQESGATGQATASASAMALPDPSRNSLITESAKHVAEANHRALVKGSEGRRGNMAYQTTSHPLQQQNSGHSARRNQNEETTLQPGLGIDFERPKHPQYAVKTVRLQSFENWPNNIHQTPPDLVEAGFYYAGFGDCVRCFFCGIGLRHWSEEDNPWIEHARWASRCVYLRQVKGDEFVDLVQLAVQYSNEEDEDIPESYNSAPSAFVQREVVPKQDTVNYLLTDAAQSVLEMGYQPRMVQKAIDVVLREKGRDGLTARTIMAEVLEIEEKETTASIQRDIASLKLESPPDTSRKKNDQDSSQAVETKKIQQQNKELKEQTVCKVCLDNPVCIVFLPCGHLVTCAECAPAMRKCPICRAVVKGTVKAYLP